MDGCTTEIALTAAAALVPIAMKYGAGCLGNRLRNPSRIQKHVLVLPPRCGKTRLHDMLVHQHQVLVIDVDEYINSVCERPVCDKLDSDPIGSFEYEMDYHEAADKVLDTIRRRIRHHKGLRVLFVTSSWKWAKQFKKDATYLCSPDSEFWDKILETEPEEAKRDELRKARTRFIDSVPDKTMIQTYSSFKELATMVRKRLNITQEL